MLFFSFLKFWFQVEIRAFRWNSILKVCVEASM